MVISSTSFPSLPFALSHAAIAAPQPPGALATQIGRLQELMLETREQVEQIRRDSAAILRLLDTEPGAVAQATMPTPQPEAANQLRFYLLGTFEMRFAGEPVLNRTSRKSRLLLAYLAMHAKRQIPRDALIELFWPDSPPSRGSNNLSIAIYQIRALLKQVIDSPHHGISVQQGLYSLDQQADCWIDVAEMHDLLAQGRATLQGKDRSRARRHFAAAVELYRGEFLASEPYEEWTVEPRRSYAAEYARALAWLAEDAATTGDWNAVTDYAKRTLERDACDEQGHRWLMTAHWKLGNRAAALLQYRICAERLQTEIGVTPSEATRKLYRTIKD